MVLSDRLPMDFFAWLLKHAWQLEALVFMGLYYEGFMAERSTPPEAIPSDNCTYDQLFDVLLLRSQGSLKELTIIACSPELASYLLDWTVRECPDLRSIKCRYNDLLEGHKEFGTLASKCPKVEHFEYWEDGASEDPRKELSIETVKAMVKGWPNLR